MNYGEKIKKARKSKNITQYMLADLSGLSRSYISALEINKYVPSIEALAKISVALDVPLSYFTDNDIGRKEAKKVVINKLTNTLLENTLAGKVKWYNLNYYENIDIINNALTRITNNKEKNYELEYTIYTIVDDTMFLLIEYFEAEHMNDNFFFHTLYDLFSIDLYEDDKEAFLIAENNDFPELNKIYNYANPKNLNEFNQLNKLIKKLENIDNE
ncbi:helix-turn-helix domain-containing protein [Peptostreptococcus porci]|uniref:helix-turn-helix domain-containing protein n=1 Tax=Peptostreptococcus porci TaxID=2652282 RepID=UPI0023F2F354|nr:helix-turn-helix transcriptional regulator [Peptostreptococcus porci]MDD7183290.1 helix-turn-helix transcriptional regulator [Peptostreptococcus porci]MDY4127973.1 helix-turn-helix transcriptional regulator [Peptostreptococcus porci]MDY4561810.1 helix-turn-helix transcriptional regulator [Peptostreptococcus porci]